MRRLLLMVRDALVPVALLCVLAPTAVAQFHDQCEVPDNGSGTADLPPDYCAYLSREEDFMIIDDLAAGTTIEADPFRLDFFCRQPQDDDVCSRTPGGEFEGGEVQAFDAVLIFELNGTGDLADFHRLLSIPVLAQTHVGPRTPGDPVQSFPTDMFALEGAIFGDPDFDQLILVGGTGFGLPSPGQTTLTRLGPPGSDFRVDSFFDIAYQIEFVGAPGGPLAGLAGTTIGNVRIESAGVEEKNRCVEPDDGSGTTELPPPGCDYLSHEEVFMIIEGPPAGTTVEMPGRLQDFVCTQPGPGGTCGQPGGNLGGEVEQFDAELVLQLAGTGSLSDFRRTLRLPVAVETHTGPRSPGDPVQSFPTDLFSLQGTMSGDPDFAALSITAGTSHGLPSPGHTVLEDRGNGTFYVDSFFDIEYQITFVGAPGGALDGFSGTTTGGTRVVAVDSKEEAIEPDILGGTAELPPRGSQYVSQIEEFLIIDGLPPGTTIELDPSHHYFVCLTEPCGQGPFSGGQIEQFESTLDVELAGTGALTGFRRTLSIPTVAQTQTGPRTPGDPIQSFNTEMVSLQAPLPPGDPDFDQLTILAGSANGLPSPGHTTLTELPSGDFQVDSFFDITYQIDFVGAPGGALDGLSGTTTGVTRITACAEPTCPTIVEVPSQTFTSDETIRSAGVARSSGALDVQADIGIIAHEFVNLGNGFSATVATGKSLALGTDDVPCPVP